MLYRSSLITANVSLTVTLASLTKSPVEFRPAIATGIPNLMKLLESSDWLVPSTAADVLSELADHGQYLAG